MLMFLFVIFIVELSVVGVVVNMVVVPRRFAVVGSDTGHGRGSRSPHPHRHPRRLHSAQVQKSPQYRILGTRRRQHNLQVTRHFHSYWWHTLNQ